MRALEPADPRVLGRYRILARLGAGGMAAVYFGRSPGHRAVAVKVMHAEFAGEPSYRARFRREVRAAEAAGGQYCPSVLGADPDADIPWLATEFLPSVSLRDAVSRHGPVPAASASRLAAGLVEALASIHRAGLAHLDLKPANVLLTHDGPRLIDFGIAAELNDDPTALAGIRAGSWGFMSPEQAAGAAVGPASDVFSFGATLAYACSGAHQAGIGTEELLRTVIARCLRADPRARPTVAELMNDLTSVTGEVVPHAPWLPAALRSEIDRLASEAENPPIAPPPAQAPAARRLSRRTLLWSGAALGATGLGAAALRLGTDEPEPTAAPPPLSTQAASGPITSDAKPTVRTVEFFVFGRTTFKTLTTVVNGRAMTVHDVPLPYRRTVRLAPWTGPGSWRIEYHCTSGLFRCVILLDGVEAAGTGASSTNDDMQDHMDGEF